METFSHDRSQVVVHLNVPLFKCTDMPCHQGVVLQRLLDHCVTTPESSSASTSGTFHLHSQEKMKGCADMINRLHQTISKSVSFGTPIVGFSLARSPL